AQTDKRLVGNHRRRRQPDAGGEEADEEWIADGRLRPESVREEEREREPECRTGGRGYRAARGEEGCPLVPLARELAGEQGAEAEHRRGREQGHRRDGGGRDADHVRRRRAGGDPPVRQAEERGYGDCADERA